MATAAEIDAQIAADALKAKSTTHDGTTIQRRDISEQIEASRHIREQEALSNARGFPFMVGKIIPPAGR